MDLTRDVFVLAAATADLSAEPSAREHADCVEFRMDLADGDPLAALDAYGGELPLLVTNRPAWEGGEADDEGRVDDLLAAADREAVAAADVELVTAREDEGVVAALRERGAAVVVSTHDFAATPDRDAMGETLREAGAYGDVAKLAVTARDRGDVLDLLAVTHARDAAGDRVATMAMGEAGRHSRAVAPLYGSRVGYAPVDPTDATAPGQYDLTTLRGLVDALRGT